MQQNAENRIKKIPIIKKDMAIWISDLVLVFQNRLGKL